MSKLARTLILATTVAAMHLAGTTAVAQTNDQDAISQQELAENWQHSQQATRVPPAELQARRQADAAQRALSERWTHYYHATRMSPAERRAWMQPRDRADTPTEPPAQVRPRGSQTGSSSRAHPVAPPDLLRPPQATLSSQSMWWV